MQWSIWCILTEPRDITNHFPQIPHATVVWHLVPKYPGIKLICLGGHWAGTRGKRHLFSICLFGHGNWTRVLLLVRLVCYQYSTTCNRVVVWIYACRIYATVATQAQCNHHHNGSISTPACYVVGPVVIDWFCQLQKSLNLFLECKREWYRDVFSLGQFLLSAQTYMLQLHDGHQNKERLGLAWQLRLSWCFFSLAIGFSRLNIFRLKRYFDTLPYWKNGQVKYFARQPDGSYLVHFKDDNPRPLCEILKKLKILPGGISIYIRSYSICCRFAG